MLENLALARNAVDDLVAARSFYAEALEIFKAAGAERLAAAVASNLAEAEFRGGNAPQALLLAAEALASTDSARFTYRVAFLFCNMAAYLVAMGRYDEARSRAREALELGRGVHYDVAVAWALQHLAAVATLQSCNDLASVQAGRARAVRLLSYVDARLAALGALREYTEQQEYDRIVAALRGALGADELARLMGDGRAWTEDRAIGEALLV